MLDKASPVVQLIQLHACDGRKQAGLSVTVFRVVSERYATFSICWIVFWGPHVSLVQFLELQGQHCWDLSSMKKGTANICSCGSFCAGSGRVTFNNQKSFMKAVAAAFVEIKTPRFSKKVSYPEICSLQMCTIINMRELVPFGVQHLEVQTTSIWACLSLLLAVPRLWRHQAILWHTAFFSLLWMSPGSSS